MNQTTINFIILVWSSALLILLIGSMVLYDEYKRYIKNKNIEEVICFNIWFVLGLCIGMVITFYTYLKIMGINP